MSLTSTTSSDADAVIIDRDDVSNYNPEQILPESAQTISKIREWLQPTSYDLENGEYRKHLTSHVTGTGGWLTCTASYQDWVKDNRYGLLWIRGIPGSGKSVQAAKLTDELSRSNPGVPVLYFFFRQIIDANHSPVALLRDWLDQVLIYSPPLQKKLKEYVDKRRTLDSLSMDDLWKDLRMAFASLPSRVYCIADALDEMDQGNHAFVQSLASLGEWKPGKVKVLVTSRPVPSVEGPLRKAKILHIRLQEDLVDVDIATYVQHCLEHSAIPLKQQNLIKDAVPGRANGLFLYAKLAMESFLEPGAKITEVLRSLPADLNTLYTDLLQEHARRSGIPGQTQLLILQWVTHATRPMRLIEIAEMIRVTYSEGEIQRDLKATKDLMRAACGSLLEILPDETLCVVHHSFTEYLKGSTRLDGKHAYPVLRLGSTHARLALACLAYLQSGCLDKVKFKNKAQDADRKYDPNKKPTMSSPDHVQLKLKYPFLEYAAFNWHIHAARSAAAGEDQSELITTIKQFFDNGQYREAWLSISWPGTPSAGSGVTSLHVAAKTGLSHYAATLLETGTNDLYNVDEIGRTPIWWAADSGHADIIRLLVRCGANPDQDETVNGLKPLHVAASNNRHEAVTALLEADVDPLTKKTREYPGRWCGNAPRSTGHTPLMYACKQGHVESVDAFLPFLKDMDTVHRALNWAAEGKQSKVIERILQHSGVDVDAKYRGDTPLFRACGNRDLASATLLIEAGADASIVCEDNEYEFAGMGRHWHDPSQIRDPARGVTAIHKLCQGGHSCMEAGDWQKMFTMLRKAGADIHKRKHCGSTPLHGAAAGNLILTRLLLDAGADVNSENDEGKTPLHHCSSADTIALLVENGADLNRPSKTEGRTPIFGKFDSYGPDALLKLLEYGPDCDVIDHDGNSILHAALCRSSSSHNSIISAILKAGANPNLKNRDGDTPLHKMCSSIDDDTANELLDMLLAAGADINARNKAGIPLIFRVFHTNSSRSRQDSHRDFKRLLSRGASTDIRDFDGRSILHEAIATHGGRPTHVNSFTPETPRFDFLLGLGLDPHVVDNTGNTLLHELAASSHNFGYSAKNYVPLWKQLLELGLDPLQGNNKGRTPLHILVSRRDERFPPLNDILPIDHLLRIVKNIDVPDGDGITPLHLASTVSELCTKKLLDAGADPLKLTFEHLTPLHLASRARQSNIVGMLLDSLYIKRPSTSRAVGPPFSLDSVRIPQNTWSCGDWEQPALGIDSLDKCGRTPLYYACRSGRPETVTLLLQAGADVNADKCSLFYACADFEEEQGLWDVATAEVSKMNGHAAGLKMRDTSRPSTAIDQSNNWRTEIQPGKDTTRLEEILKMLADRGAKMSGHDNRALVRHGAAMNLRGRGGYTVECISKLNDGRSENIFDDQATVASNDWDEHANQFFRKATTEALHSFSGIKRGERNQSMFGVLLRRREYARVIDLYHLGTDFLTTDLNGIRSLNILIQHGFASLLETIGTLEAEANFKEGKWHAVGDPQKAGLGQCTEPEPEKGHHSPPSPFLLEAVQRSLPNMEVIRVLVEKLGVDMHAFSYEKNWFDDEYIPTASDSALHHAARGTYWWHVTLAIPYLAGKGANIELRNYKGQTPLHIALGGDEKHWPGPFHEHAALALISAGADVNAVDEDGTSCLSYAGRSVSLTRLLVKQGADIKPDAIFTAVKNKQRDVLEYLLAAGADPNGRREAVARPKTQNMGLRFMDGGPAVDERYPLYHAAWSYEAMSYASAEEKKETNEASMRIIEVLLAHGANPFANFLSSVQPEDDEDGDDQSANGDKEPELADDKPPAPQDGADDGDVDSRAIPKGYKAYTVLHQLLMGKGLIDPFVEVQGLDPNRRDPEGRTLLHAICHSRMGPDAPIKQLTDKLDVGPSIPSRLNYVLSLGADPLARDDFGRNALHSMLDLGVCRYLDDRKFATSLKQMATSHPALLNQRDAAGKTPIHIAIERAVHDQGKEEEAIVGPEVLLAAGADPLTIDGDGNSALHILAQRLKTSESLCRLFKTLLDQGLNVNARNEKGETPLFSFFGRVERRLEGSYGTNNQQTAAACTMFDEAGADFFARDKRGRGLLHVAAAQKCVESFRALLDRGLDPMVQDNEERTALDVAAACGRTDVLGLFERGADDKLKTEKTAVSLSSIPGVILPAPRSDDSEDSNLGF